MRTFIAITLAWLLAIAGPSSAQMTLTGAGSVKAAGGAPPAPSYTFLGAQDLTNSTTGNPDVYTITTTGVGGRLIAAFWCQCEIAVSTVVFDPGGANIPLSLDFTDGTNADFFYSANLTAAQAGTGSKTIAVTFASSARFFVFSGAAWLGTNLTTGFVTGAAVQGGVATLPITVGANQFLFAMTANVTLPSPSDFSGSTSLPNGTRVSTTTTSGPNSATADWMTPAVSCSCTAFTVNPVGQNGGSFTFGATYK
jgi:hypothetical protein